MEGETPAATTRVFIGNLPLDCTTADIEAIMRTREWSDEVIRKCDVHLVRDRESDKFKGFCYADVGTPERAKEMLELTGADFAGRRLKIDLATPKDGGHRGGRGGRGGPGGRGGFRGGRGGEGSGRGGFRGGPPRDRRESDRERRGPRPPRTSEGESHNANNNVAADEAPKPAGRPRLQLKPRCTDPAELEAKRQREAEEEAARKAKLFQA